jgi:hypothetical protein
VGPRCEERGRRSVVSSTWVANAPEARPGAWDAQPPALAHDGRPQPRNRRCGSVKCHPGRRGESKARSDWCRGSRKSAPTAFRGVQVARPLSPDRHLDPLLPQMTNGAGKVGGVDLQTQVTSPGEARMCHHCGPGGAQVLRADPREVQAIGRTASRGPGRPCRGAGSPRRRPRRG